MRIGNVIAYIIGAAIVLAVSGGITEIAIKESKVPVSRPWYFFLSLIFLFVLSIVAGFVASAGVDAGEVEESTHKVALESRPPMPAEQRDVLIEKIFIYLMFPALLGVRLALGPKKQ